MDLRALLLLVLLAGILAPAGRAADEAERAPGTIRLSDGTEWKGPIRTTSGKPLRLVEAGTGHRLDLAVEEIHRIRIHVVHEEEYRIWRWVEDGSREKVYTGESYPKRDYETEITLRSGQVRRGDMVAVLYVYLEGSAKPKKAILRKQEQGEVGETLADLVYVESVEFDGAAPTTAGGEGGLWLKVVPGDKVLAAHAVPRNRDRSMEGVSMQRSGAFLFPDLLPGTFDLAVVTSRFLYLWLGVGKEGGAPLDEETMALIRTRVAEVADFFEHREVLHAVREGDRVRAVVKKTRRGPTSMGGQRTFFRIEIWCLHKGGDRWLVDQRCYLWRDHGEGLETAPEVKLTTALGGFKVKSGGAMAEFEIPEGDR